MVAGRPLCTLKFDKNVFCMIATLQIACRVYKFERLSCLTLWPV